jgi:membrane protein involved in colicin uptake
MYIKDSFFFLSIFEEKFFFFFSTKAQKVFPTKTSTKNAKKKNSGERLLAGSMGASKDGTHTQGPVKRQIRRKFGSEIYFRGQTSERRYREIRRYNWYICIIKI